MGELKICGQVSRCAAADSLQCTREELGHSVVGCARTTCHGFAPTTPLPEQPRANVSFKKEAHNMVTTSNFVAKFTHGIRVMSQQLLVKQRQHSEQWRPDSRSFGHGCARATSRLCPAYYTRRGHGCARTTQRIIWGFLYTNYVRNEFHCHQYMFKNYH